MLYRLTYKRGFPVDTLITGCWQYVVTACISADRATGAELASTKAKAHVVASSNFVAEEAGLGDW